MINIAYTCILFHIRDMAKQISFAHMQQVTDHVLM